MKKTIVPIFLVLFAFACSQTSQKTGESDREAGVEEASASHTQARAVVSFDPGKTNKEAISQAISDAGYEVAGTEL